MIPVPELGSFTDDLRMFDPNNFDESRADI